MTTAEMLDRIKRRTFQTDDVKIIDALDSAQDWAFNRVYDTEAGADLLVTMDEELTLTADTQTYDVGSNLAFTIVGFKALWTKLPNEPRFTPMVEVDATHPAFQQRDTLDATVTAVHPIHYYVENFSSVRFDALLPSGAVLRVDYFRRPPALDPTTNNAQEDGSDLPEELHEAIVDYATAEIWDFMDDSRADKRRQYAEYRLNDALFVLRDRVKGPTTTLPWRRRRSRYVG